MGIKSTKLSSKSKHENDNQSNEVLLIYHQWDRYLKLLADTIRAFGCDLTIVQLNYASIGHHTGSNLQPTDASVESDLKKLEEMEKGIPKIPTPSLTAKSSISQFIFDNSNSTVIRSCLATFANNELTLMRRLKEIKNDENTLNPSALRLTESCSEDPFHLKPSSTARKSSASLKVNLQGHLKEKIIDSIAQIHQKDCKFKDNSRLLSKATSSPAIEQYHKGDKHRHLDLGGPLCKAIGVLADVKNKCPNALTKELQKAIDLIYSSDTFSNQLFDVEDAVGDPLRSDFVGGLMMTTNKSRRRSSIPKPSSITSALKVIDNEWSQEIRDSMQLIDEWEFDILRLEEVTQKRPLRYLGMQIFDKFNFSNVLQIPNDLFAEWLAVIESNYHPANPYHNATHAADVTQSAAYLLRRDSINPLFDSFDECTILLACIVHDLDHPGRTNPFLVNSGHPLALLYNDQAVLESHHVALAFELTLNNPRINIFQHLSQEDYQNMRTGIIDMVLATEMARHFDIVNKFYSNISKPISAKKRTDRDADPSLIDNWSQDPINEAGVKLDEEDSSNDLSVDLSDPDNRCIIKRLIIKCSDVNNQTRSLDLCKQWAAKIAEEYFAQTDEEREKGLPVVLPTFDRKVCNIPKSQTVFIEFFLNEMFDAFNTVFPIPTLIRNLESNYNYWRNSQPVENSSL